MPIEVHCPSPECARVHQVKNKYAGMRGKCPACGSWMYVPREGMMPSMIAPRPEGLAGAAEARGRPAAKAVSLPDVVVEELPPEEEAPKKKRPARKPVEEDEVAVEEAADEPKPRLRKLPVFLLLLVMLALGVIPIAPFLSKPEAKSTGDLSQLKLSQPEGIPEEKQLFVMLAPVPVVVVLLLALMTALATKEWGGSSITLIYIATLLVAGLMFLAGHELQANLDTLNTKIPREVERMKAAGRTGGFEGSLGLQLPVAAGGVAAAAFFLLLTVIAVHQRAWARIVGFLFLLTPMALLSVWAFRKELGIDL